MRRTSAFSVSTFGVRHPDPAGLPFVAVDLQVDGHRASSKLDAYINVL